MSAVTRSAEVTVRDLRVGAYEVPIWSKNGWLKELSSAADSSKSYDKADLLKRGLATATIARRLAALRSMVKLARALGRIAWTLDIAGPKAEPYRDTRGPGLDGWRTLWAFALMAVIWSSFLVDKLLVELSPHWSQKHVLASYFKLRKGPEEPLIAWQLYWRGENFYTKNAIYSSANAAERTVFLGDRNQEKLQQYLKEHPGRRVFFVVERVRYETLKGLLPEAARASMKKVDESNNKIYLVTAQL